MRIVNLRHPGILIEEFITEPGNGWCLYGENRSGIDEFIAFLSGRLEGHTVDDFLLPPRTGIFSFALQQELFEEEIRNDNTDFLGHPDPGSLVRSFLPTSADSLPLVKKLAMDHLLDHGYRQLSSGQSRKLLLIRELLRGVTCLLIQNPFDGLDEKSCSELNHAFSELLSHNIELLISVNNLADIPDWCSHLAIFRNRRIETAGPREQVQADFESRNHLARENGRPAPALSGQSKAHEADRKEELIALRDGWAGYGDRILFCGLNLSVCTGDHTLITGPNGCGKSTLLDIITGDNPKCYANKLRLFGVQRGSGESIWDIKKHMGIVSPSLHRDHRVPGSALHIVISGLYDSIGLYRKVQSADRKKGLAWLDWLGLADVADVPFRRLPFAEQRLILIARGLIKEPKLLVLDEPTQGLDTKNRNRFLDLLAKGAKQQLTTILFVSHRKDEHRPFFRRHIRLNTYTLQKERS